MTHEMCRAVLAACMYSCDSGLERVSLLSGVGRSLTRVYYVPWAAGVATPVRCRWPRFAFGLRFFVLLLVLLIRITISLYSSRILTFQNLRYTRRSASVPLVNCEGSAVTLAK